MPTVSVNPKLIRWAIDRSGVSHDVLTERFPKLEDWISEVRQPTLRQLEDFARKTMTPFGLLLLDEPPDEELPIPDFRTVGDASIRRPSPNLIDTIYEIQRRQAFMRDFLIEEGQGELPFVGSGRHIRNVKTLAQRIRKELDLAPDWAETLSTWESALKTLRSAIEQIGILVFSNSVVGLNNHRPIDPEEFRGFVLCDPIAPAIFVNDADSKSARMFTLAHELTHVAIGTDGIFNLVNMMPHRDSTERFCNAVAAEFLIPEYKLLQIWKNVSGQALPFHEVARRFKVSPVVAARRALDLKLINREKFFEFYKSDRQEFLNLKSQRKLQKKRGGNFHATLASRLGQRFSSAVVRATREGRLNYQQTFRVTGVTGDTINRYADFVLARTKNERQ